MSAGFGKTTRRDLLRAGTAAAGLLAMPHVGRAADAIRFSLEFRIYGGNAPAFLAAEKGIYRDLNLDVTVDGSSGSAESVRRIATGTHDFGLADMSTIVEFTARNPNAAPKLLMPVFDKFPGVVLSLSRRPIKTPQDMVGAKIGTGPVDAGAKLFPALMAHNKIDPKTVNRVNVDVKIRETMLIKGEVDGVVGFDYTSIFNLMEAGIKQDDITLFYFSDYGFDLWGNSFMASPAIIEKNPDLVRRVATAVARAWVAANKDRPGAIAAVSKRDKLLKPETELARLSWLLDRLVVTPNVRQNGLGVVTPDRLNRGLAAIKDGFGLPSVPTIDQLYDGRFLPPAADRKMA
jgi:NitT/TauT family transport system substrate-binding protein